MNYFENKIIWITGSSSGIGEGFVNHLSNVDCKLVISARRKEELERVKNANANAKADILIYPMDLTQADQISTAVAQVKSEVGDVDLVIHSGGISQRDLVLDTSMEVQRQIMEVNYFGTIDLARQLLPGMVNKQSGHHVVITSAVGIISTPLRSGYCASKHALHGFFDSLRAEHYKDNVDVTLICPGYVNTKISYNALLGDGAKQNTLDEAQANGLTVDQFAIKALKAIAQRKEEVYIGGLKEVMGIYMKRFFPGVFSKIVRKVNVT